MKSFLWSVVIVGSAVLAAPVAARGEDSSSSGIGSPPPRKPVKGAPTSNLRPGRPTPKIAEVAASDANDIVQIIDESLSRVILRPDQSAALQEIGNDVDAKVGAVDQARGDALVVLSDQVEAGKVDPAALRAETQAIVDAAAAASPELRSGFEKIHDVLDSDQRREFVSGFRAAMNKRASLVDPKTQIEQWSERLKLTGEQKQTLGAILGGTPCPTTSSARAQIGPRGLSR